MAPHSSVLAWKIPWTEEPSRLQSMGLQGVRHDWATSLTHLLSKSLIQFSVEGRGCVSSMLFDLRPNYGGGNEDNGDLLQKAPCMYCCTQCPWPCSRPPPTHASTRDSWTLTGKSGSVSCVVTAPFSWVLVHKVLFVPSQSLFPRFCVSSGGSMLG